MPEPKARGALRIEDVLVAELEDLKSGYEICGMIDRAGRVYPLGSDTKVLSAAFEMVSRPVMQSTARTLGCEVVEPKAQNYYPDFTFLRDMRDARKIAVDVKTTYRRNRGDTFGYTLGSYTSFIRRGNERKNIVFPFTEYDRHLVVGFVYDRIVSDIPDSSYYTAENLADIRLPFENVDFFVQDKWRIASDRAGSGNTTNIGSITGTMEDFRAGNGPFRSEEEFLEYWRSYGKTLADRTDYSNLDDFRRLKQRGD